MLQYTVREPGPDGRTDITVDNADLALIQRALEHYAHCPRANHARAKRADELAVDIASASRDARFGVLAAVA